MSWLSRRVHQSIRAMLADQADGYIVNGPRAITVHHNRRRALRRTWARTHLYKQRLYRSQLLHKGGKP